MFPPPHFPFLSLRGRKLKVSLIVGARVNCLLALFPTCMLFVFSNVFFSLSVASNSVQQLSPHVLLHL